MGVGARRALPLASPINENLFQPFLRFITTAIGVVNILPPMASVVANVFPNPAQFRFVADNVLIIIPLPYDASGLFHFINASRARRFECPDNRG